MQVDTAFMPPPKAARGRPDWARDANDWPNRTHSRFIHAGGIDWHVQIAGSGPVMLMLHGTGAATHSWRDMLVDLAAHYTVIAPDLPGHGFTEQPARAGMTLPGMAKNVAALLKVLDVVPEYTVGHSAGAAVLAEMCLDGMIAPKVIISLNGAMLPLPFHGIAAPLIRPLTKLFASNPVVPVLFAWQASDGRVIEKLLAGTGSKIDAIGKKFYGRLARHSGHAGAALTMMANWDLVTFSSRLPELKTQLILVAAENDRSIPASDAQRVKALLPSAEIRDVPKLGHLAHEEEPAMLVGLIEEICR